MKKIYNLIYILTLVFIPMFSYGADDNSIRIDNKVRSLIAPEACSYQWLKDGKIIHGATQQAMPVHEGGTYSVEMTEASGNSSVGEITVAINAVGAIIRIYTIGDSTVQDYNDGYYPRKGWGQVLPYFFNSSNVQVINKAVGGTSSMSFYNNHWTAVKNSLQPGDYVFIQFGINDRNKADPNRYSPTGGVFEGYLTRFVNETKAKGAYPVLVSTLRRNAWNADGVTVYDAYHEHPVAVRTVAKNLNVPLIDLDAKAKVLMESAGKTYCTRFWYNNYVAGEYPNYNNGNTDDVHFQEMGAIEMANLIVQGIEELKTDPNVSKLIPFLKPRHPVKVIVNPAGADIATTRNGNYPEGLTITMKTLPKTSGTYQHWNNGSGTQLSTKTLTTVKSGPSSSVYYATYRGATSTCSATITASSATTFCNEGSVTLTANSGSSYIWKIDNTQVGTAQSYVAQSSGNYTVEVTHANGCKAISAASAVDVQEPAKWYADTDGDGKGDPDKTKLDCVQPAGYVSNSSDLCPQDNSKAEPGACGCGKAETSCVDCADVLNGTATLDGCGVCVGGNTGKIACVGKLQAEDACVVDGVINESINAGFEGTGYVNTDNAIGTSVVFSFNTDIADKYTLLIRYANGAAASRYASVEVNGTDQNISLAFPSTGLFSAWSTLEMETDLTQGNNMIKLSALSSDGLPNIDYIGVTDHSVIQGSCIVTGIDDKLSGSDPLIAFPNPFTDDILLENTQEFSYSITDCTGKEVESGNGLYSKRAGWELIPGVYTLKIQTEYTSAVKLIMKK